MKKKPIYNDVLLVYLYEETKDTKYLSALTESGWKLVTEIPPRNLIHIFTNYIDIPKKYFKKIWLRYTSNPTTYHPINREYMKTITWDWLTNELTVRQLVLSLNSLNCVGFYPSGDVDLSEIKRKVFAYIMKKKGDNAWSKELMEYIERTGSTVDRVISIYLKLNYWKMNDWFAPKMIISVKEKSYLRSLFKIYKKPFEQYTRYKVNWPVDKNILDEVKDNKFLDLPRLERLLKNLGYNKEVDEIKRRK